ncbi:hypothetical protein MLD38_004552 [Melastoma candidum]|uniref:Uncharacterized protein n=1 Tax=Melastoma candidum TaxID=119954 RepID=A0ACB9S623_9MYRT|nr:hypothetical protein MLD38_004552 [Melastoma candidum]
MQDTRTVEVRQLSDLATEREIHEFFSFSGEIDHVEIRRDSGQSRIAFVTFKDPKALEIALMLSGATLVDRIVSITAAHDYVPSYGIQHARMVDNSECVVPPESISQDAEARSGSPGNGRMYVSKAQDVVSSVLAKGTAIGQDAMNKAKAFDEKHKLTATASAKRLQVSDKTVAAILAAERKINNTGSAVKTSRYVTAGTTWLNGAFSKVSKAGQTARSKTREKFHMAVSNLTAKEPPVVA